MENRKYIEFYDTRLNERIRTILNFDGSLECQLSTHYLKFFEITERHLALIQRLRFYQKWDREYDYAVPAVPLYRPYGNSDLLGDIGEALQLTPNGELIDEVDGVEVREWLEVPQALAMKRLHNNVTLALQICTQTLHFFAGLYASDQNSDWGLVDDKKEFDLLRYLYIIAKEQWAKYGSEVEIPI